MNEWNLKVDDDSISYKGFNPQKYVGGYRIGERDGYYAQFNLTYKPNWFHRTMMRLCFGYKWVNL